MNEEEFDEKLAKLANKYVPQPSNQKYLYNGDLLSWEQFKKQEMLSLVNGIEGLTPESYLNSLEIELFEKYVIN